MGQCIARWSQYQIILLGDRGTCVPVQSWTCTSELPQDYKSDTLPLEGLDYRATPRLPSTEITLSIPCRSQWRDCDTSWQKPHPDRMYLTWQTMIWVHCNINTRQKKLKYIQLLLRHTNRCKLNHQRVISTYDAPLGDDTNFLINLDPLATCAVSFRKHPSHAFLTLFLTTVKLLLEHLIQTQFLFETRLLLKPQS